VVPASAAINRAHTCTRPRGRAIAEPLRSRRVVGTMTADWFVEIETPVHTTSVSLLARLRLPGDAQAWRRFVDMYTPLLYYWARRMGLQQDDAADLVQEVFAVLLRKLPEFTYDHDKSFRSWLRTVTLNKWRELQRRQAILPQSNAASALGGLTGPDTANDLSEREYRQLVVGRALHIMQCEFEPSSWKAFWEMTVNGRAAAEVAKELGLSPGAARAAKFRVLSKLRHELEGLLD
jgi:RNA polymerase sigma-70 factor, ECF subfamily